MKILALSDMPDRALWDYYQPERLVGIDLILAAGDLDRQYLEFIATMARVPVFYIHGNHDGSYDRNPPQGCLSIEDRLVVYQGVRILGLGGCLRYNGGPHQYSQREMALRAARRRLDLRRQGGLDILLTHSPALGWNDGKDRAHTGFEAFQDLITLYQPAYHIYGHVHPAYLAGGPVLDRVGSTRLVNACPRAVIQFPPPEKAGLSTGFSGKG